MKILVLWPPHVPSYFNAGHHLGAFGVGAHLRSMPEVDEVQIVDAGALNYNWKELGDIFFQGGFDVIAVMNEFDVVDDLDRLLAYIHELSPSSRTITFGRLSNRIPRFFTHFGFDAIVHTGDYECGVADFVRGVAAGSLAPIPGVFVKTDDGWLEPPQAGRFLSPDDWVLPDVADIPYEAYDRMYQRDESKFCGIPLRRELVVPAARGCPVRCDFCEVPGLQGIRDRRLSVERTIEYIRDAFSRAPFEYVAFYAPTFTLNKRWVHELCDAMIAEGARWPWKCATTIAHLDETLVTRMGEARCVRISVGLETLDAGGFESLPRLKRTEFQRFDALARWCTASGIELNCFIIVGLPGVSAEGVMRTVEYVRERGARVRPTMYTPINELREDMSVREVAKFNRHTLFGEHDPQEARALYGILFGFEPAPTRVMERVPTIGMRAEAAS